MAGLGKRLGADVRRRTRGLTIGTRDWTTGRAGPDTAAISRQWQTRGCDAHFNGRLREGRFGMRWKWLVLMLAWRVISWLPEDGEWLDGWVVDGWKEVGWLLRLAQSATAMAGKGVRESAPAEPSPGRQGRGRRLAPMAMPHPVLPLSQLPAGRPARTVRMAPGTASHI